MEAAGATSPSDRRALTDYAKQMAPRAEKRRAAVMREVEKYPADSAEQIAERLLFRHPKDIAGIGELVQDVRQNKNIG